MSEPRAPEVSLDVKAGFLDVAAALDGLGRAADAAGPLDERERRLVKLGLATGSGASGAVRSNARRALAAGASPDEVLHTMALVVSTAGMSAAVAGYRWCLDVIDAA